MAILLLKRRRFLRIGRSRRHLEGYRQRRQRRRCCRDPGGGLLRRRRGSDGALARKLCPLCHQRATARLRRRPLHRSQRRQQQWFVPGSHEPTSNPLARSWRDREGRGHRRDGPRCLGAPCASPVIPLAVLRGRRYLRVRLPHSRRTAGRDQDTHAVRGAWEVPRDVGRVREDLQVRGSAGVVLRGGGHRRRVRDAGLPEGVCCQIIRGAILARGAPYSLQSIVSESSSCSNLALELRIKIRNSNNSLHW